jgi:ubiquinone/menaquinone biosynthesis C-methylase UbiE
VSPPITQTSYLSRFRGKATQRIDAQDRVRAVPFIEAMKERSIELLDIRAGSRVLDVGCGCGEDMRSLSERVSPGGRAVGASGDAALLAEAQDRAAELVGSAVVPELILADAGALPFADASFDGARADGVLVHSRRPDIVLAEMRRVTAPGGRIVITEVSNRLVVDDEDIADVPGELFNSFQSPTNRASSVAEVLPLLLARATQRPVEVTRERAATSEWESMTAVGRFATVAQSLIDSGDLADDWLDRLHDAADCGLAHVQIEAVHVRGSGPPAPGGRAAGSESPS